ncbi:MAG: carbohydrate ABC transporter permease [Clostridia bacterium]|nr:carbohydrate ABC transporter permease [Clostridia bacterium]
MATTKTKNAFGDRRVRTRIKNIVFYTILCIVGIMMILPTFVMVTSSLKTYDEYYSMVFTFLPKEWAFDNYVRVFQENADFMTWIGNTLMHMVTSTAICTISSIFVAYGFAKFRCKLADALFMVLLCTMMIPWAVTMIPSYIVWARLGMTDSYWPLILPSIGGSAFYIFMFKQNMRGIPNEMIEAAEIDGANSFRRLWWIIVPNCIPAIVTMILFTSMGIWGDYLGPLIYLRQPYKFNISLGLNMLRAQTTQGKQDTPMLLAASVLMAIPSVVMYFVGTKIFAKGISLQGGLKG